MSIARHVLNISAAFVGALVVTLFVNRQVLLAPLVTMFLVGVFSLYVSDFAVSRMKKSHG